MPALYVLTGLPGAGKSVRAAAIVAATGAAHVDMDTALRERGVSIVDYETRFAMQPEVEASIAPLLAAGRDVVAEFGSWTREERERLRSYADASGARTELHWLDAPPEECVGRLRARGGEGAEQLVTIVTEFAPEGYERPTADEGAGFDAYVPPGVEWEYDGAES
ncbi:ATP-binding protein [Demequina sp. TTPB684]|uniref:AAA family ATPase n=1 Tax=unclassified Demequina TaxID=2620311 RepID=UPI001CF1B68E|nr:MULTISPECIES: ATP-binding protein [unclassified Demequina]MCB2413255.1 ATP-binding protein [Demequina sp. TTPB684]UPU88715.1 ATP-binding protein [Demequina sp. TMPB413]